MTEKEAKKLTEAAKKTLRSNDVNPDYVGWAKVYVEAEKHVPEAWRSEFYDELVSEDLEYRRALEESLRYFGVRWTK